MSVPDLEKMTTNIIAAVEDISGGGDASAANQVATQTLLGAVDETAPASDTASSGHNGRLQRLAQHFTTLLSRIPTTLGAGGGLKVDGSGTELPVSLSSVPSHAVTNAGTFAVQASEADGANVTLGAKADAKSTSTDTTAISAMSVWKQISASVQAIATSVAGSLTVATHAVTQSGTWTVQPGNTANTTAWKVDGSAVTQPISMVSVPSHAVTNAGTFAVQATEADGANTTLGAKADAKSTATDTTSVSAMSVWKQISASVQAIATSIAGVVATNKNIVTIKTSFILPSNTTAYSANDALADQAAVAGGFTLTSAARSSGGTGTITGAVVSMSGGTVINGEIWIFDQSVTVTADNSALSVSDTDILNLVGIIPFITNDVTAANAAGYTDGLSIDFTCVGTANLRFLVKVMTDSGVHVSGETFALTVKIRN